MNFAMLSDFFLKVKDAFLNFGIVDGLDILLVTGLIYVLIKQLRKSQSIQVIKGILVVGGLYVLVFLLGMEASKFLFNRVLGDIIIIFALIFSPELRRGLEGLGKGKWARRLLGPQSTADVDIVIHSVADAAKKMAEEKTGSLIIIQRSTLLGQLTGSAVEINADVSEKLLRNLFFKNSPLHDGAVVIGDGKILAAGCIIPLESHNSGHKHYGTRHRAALEVSRNSDAVVVVTSEERGVISVAAGGTLDEDVSVDTLIYVLEKALIGTQDKKSAGRGFSQKSHSSEDDSEKATVDNLILPGEEKSFAEEQKEQNAESKAVETVSELPVLTNEGDLNDEQE